MLNRKKALLLCLFSVAAIALCILAAFLFAPEQVPLKNPLACCQEIAGIFSLTSDHAYEVNVQTITQVEGMEFNKESKLTLHRRFKDAQPVLTYAQETATMEDFEYTCNRWLEDGTLYIELNGSRFAGEYSQRDSFPPLFPFSVQLYSNVSGYRQNDIVTIDLTDATAAEEWVLPPDGVFLSASGTVTATKENALLQCTYIVSYTLGGQSITQKYTVTPLSQENFSLPIPDKASFRTVSAVEVPLVLEQMSGYLLQAQQIDSDYNEYIYCQAFGDQRTREMALTINKNQPFSASLHTISALVNSSRGENSTSVQQVEQFQNGIYSRSTNHEMAIPDASVTQQQFLKHCQDILVGTILLPQFIGDITVQEDERSVTYLLTPTPELAALLCEEAGQNLYQDPTVLTGTATEAATELLSAYLTVDKATGLPCSSGIHYKGIYTITDLPYRLEYTTDQTYRLS